MVSKGIMTAKLPTVMQPIISTRKQLKWVQPAYDIASRSCSNPGWQGLRAYLSQCPVPRQLTSCKMADACRIPLELQTTTKPYQAKAQILRLRMLQLVQHVHRRPKRQPDNGDIS
jgi:hypothetical protein